MFLNAAHVPFQAKTSRTEPLIHNSNDNIIVTYIILSKHHFRLNLPYGKKSNSVITTSRTFFFFFKKKVIPVLHCTATIYTLVRFRSNIQTSNVVTYVQVLYIHTHSMSLLLSHPSFSSSRFLLCILPPLVCAGNYVISSQFSFHWGDSCLHLFQIHSTILNISTVQYSTCVMGAVGRCSGLRTRAFHIVFR
jgi:hypothetical protein